MKIIILTILLPTSILFAQTKPRNPIAPSGSWAIDLVRAYLFSRYDSTKADSVQDWSANNVWGIIVNTGSWTADVDAAHKPAWKLSGSNDYMGAGSVAASGITDSISVFGVFNDVGSGAQNEPVSFSNRLATPEQTMHFRDDDGSAPLDWQFGVYTSSMVEATADSIPNDGTTPYNGFFSLLGTYDGANVRVYRDGVLQGTAAQTGNVLIASWTMEVGRSTNGSGLFSHWNDGIVAAVYVWRRVLSASEIAALQADPYVMFRADSESTNYYRRKLIDQ